MSIEIGSGVTSQVMDLKTSKPGVTRKEEIKTGFKNINDYSSYLRGKYDYMNAGEISMKGIKTTVNVSPAFLEKCNSDPQKAAWLEENLAALPECTEKSIAGCLGTIISQRWEIDANGNMTVYTCGTNDPDGKIAKENAKRRAAEEKAAKKKLEEKRKEKQEQEKLLEERRIQNDEGDFEISIIGRDIKSITSQLTEKFATGLTDGVVASFDAVG